MRHATENCMTKLRRLPTDHELTLHPIARRHIVAAALLGLGLVAFLWPTSRSVDPAFAAGCARDPSANQAVARLIQDRDEAAETRINDAVLSPYRARENCR
jgi:hypothetical protein